MTATPSATATAALTVAPTRFIERLPTANIVTPVAVRTGCSAAAAAIRHYSAGDVAAALASLGAHDFRNAPLGVLTSTLTIAVDQRPFIVPDIAPRGGQFLLFGCTDDTAAAFAELLHAPDPARYLYIKGNNRPRFDNALGPVEAERYQAGLERLP